MKIPEPGRGSARDANDPLSALRERFYVPLHDGRECLYLCGNSLGLQPKTTATWLAQELDDWRTLGVHGHFHAMRPWMPYHEQATAGLAALTGAGPGEVVAMNTLTVNLHLMMVSFYRPSGERHKILIERPAFPSDHYAVESQIRFHGLDPAQSLLEIGPREGETAIREADLAELIEREGPSIALIVLGGVQYYSGQLFDMEAITRTGHAQGCMVGFDLAHAIGNVPLELHEWDVDFAVWCHYKYVNSGPGAVAGCFVHERHATADLPRFAGWWGHDKATRFRMGPDFHPTPGAEGWQLSNPPVLALAPVLASLEIFQEVGMDALRARSVDLTRYLERLLGERLADEVEILTPSDPSARGCQLSLRLRHAEAGRNTHARLEAAGVVCDWREPDVIRVAPVPLYNRFDEMERFVDILADSIT